MRRALGWWPWLLCAGALLALGLYRVHVMQMWLANGAFLACAVLLVLGTCRNARPEDAAPRETTEKDQWS